MDSPAFLASKVVPIPAREWGPSGEIARVHNARIDPSGKDGTRFRRRQPVVLRNPDNGAWTLRVILGAGQGIEGLTEEGVAIDYDAAVEIGLRKGTPYRIEVLPAREHHVVLWYWNHRDPGLRLSMRLGVVGLVLGILSLALC